MAKNVGIFRIAKPRKGASSFANPLFFGLPGPDLGSIKAPFSVILSPNPWQSERALLELS